MLPSQPPAPTAYALSEQGHLAGQALLALIREDDSSEVLCNGPREILLKVAGQRYSAQINFESVEEYHAVLNEYVLAYTDTLDRIDGTTVLVEGQLEIPSDNADEPPTLARVHILAPPLTQYAKVTIAKKARFAYSLESLQQAGAMSPQMQQFLSAAAHGRLNTLISGPTGSGKTTLLQAMSLEFDQNDRVIVIEDTPELRLTLGDVVYLCATSARPGLNPDDVITMEWLVKAANRMRMDRVIVGECRGAEVAEFLIAANSGAEGSMTTIHAESPRRALDKMLSLATKSPSSASENTLVREIAQSLHLVVQASLIDGRHVITGIEEISRTITGNGIIQTQPLFEYDRSTGVHVARNRASEELAVTLQQRGVAVDPGWWR